MTETPWRPMRPQDLPRVLAIAAIVHPGYPERPEVFAERLALFPDGCFIAEAGGYAVAHPGLIGYPPELDSLLGALPAQPDCLYLHDVALLPEARGLGLGRALTERLHAAAVRHGLDRLALTAVNGSVPFWQNLGFTILAPDARLAAKLASYDTDAAYMLATTDAVL